MSDTTVLARPLDLDWSKSMQSLHLPTVLICLYANKLTVYKGCFSWLIFSLSPSSARPGSLSGSRPATVTVHTAAKHPDI